MENALITWLFNVAPIIAVGIVAVFALLRTGRSYGRFEGLLENYENRFLAIDNRFLAIENRITKIETDLTELRKDLNEVKVSIARLDARMDGLERRMDGLDRQMQTIIDLLIEKKSV